MRGPPEPRSGEGNRKGRIEIGGVARAHGIRGEVVIVTHDPDTDLVDFGALWIDGKSYKVLGVRDTPRGWLVELVGVLTRNDAELLKGQPVEIDRDQLEMSDGDVLLSDLIGCTVTKLDGTSWGKITSIAAGAMQNVLVITDGNIERMLPMVDEFVKTIDLEASVVTIDPPDGIPELKL